MDSNLNEILYREFWVETTRANVRSLSQFLCDNVGEEHFDKLEEAKISTNDIKDLLAYIELTQYTPSNDASLREKNLVRRITLLAQKLERKLNK